MITNLNSSHIKTFIPALLVVLFMNPALSSAYAEDRPQQDATIAAKKHNLMIDAETLMRAKRYKEAFALLSHFRDSRRGEPMFEVLYGRAALASGHAREAIVAFSKVLEISPNNVMARHELASAYLLAGNTGLARQELEILKAMHLPDALAQSVEARLSSLDKATLTKTQPAAGKTNNLSAYLEGSIGYNSNVNNATALTQITIPVLGNLPLELSRQGTSQSDYYSRIGGGLQATLPLTKEWALFLNADIYGRNNASESNFNIQSANLQPGVVFFKGPHLGKVNLRAGEMQYGGNYNHHTLGGDAEYRYILNDHAQIFGFLNYSEMRFSSSLREQNFDQTIAGIGYLHSFEPLKSAVSVSAFRGYEDAVGPASTGNPSGGRIDGNQDIYGLAIAGQMTPISNVDTYMRLTLQHGEYTRENIVFLKTREDERYITTLGAAWRFAPDWSLRPQYTYTVNDSNVPVNDFRQHDFSITLRKDFR